MEAQSIFRNLSPLDHRYYLSNSELFSQLADYISEEANTRYCVQVELALLKAHGRRAGVSPEKLAQLDQLHLKVDPAEIYEEEEKTQHNIRALVNVIKRYIDPELNPFVHLAATSVDVLDTAQGMRLRDVTQKVILPQLITLENHLISLAKDHAETPQTGRTHGQFAVPVTLGYTFAEYLSRLGKSIEAIYSHSNNLRGKIAGAVGAYNAINTLYPDPLDFERETLAELGLQPSDHSTQMVEPEYHLRLLLEINVAFGIIANLADDLRNLQRSEIDELREYFSETQVGSSTMPQKRNPWNSEHVKSLWKAFAPRVMTFFMDQISEHQRDLTNSASGRFVAEYLSGFSAAVARMNKILKGLKINTERLMENLSTAGDSLLAEPLYILLARAGEADGHEIIRKLTLEKEERKIGLLQLLKEKPYFETVDKNCRETLGLSAEELFGKPYKYSGKAAYKARTLADDFKSRMIDVSRSLEQ